MRKLPGSGFSEKRRNGLRRVFPYGEFDHCFYRCLLRADSERSFAGGVRWPAFGGKCEGEKSARLQVAKWFDIGE